MSESTKEQARNELRHRVPALSAESARGMVTELVKILKYTPNVRTVLLYSPVNRGHEVDVTSLLTLCPAVQFEILGNTKDTLFPTTQFDAILVPLLGFNDKGYRLGHGGGWYDKFLPSQLRALKIGVGHESMLVDFEPENHDVPMDIIITETQMRDFR